MSDDRPIRPPKIGTTTYERPFREGYLNPRLNRFLDYKWREPLDTDTYETHIGFLDTTDHWSAVDDEIEELNDDSRTKAIRQRLQRKGSGPR